MLILKFYLHISHAEQTERLQSRIDTPDKRWKLSPADFEERQFWDAYIKAYDDILSQTSHKNAPWFVIPSDHKWFRDLAISRILVETMEKMDIELPKPTVDIAAIRRKYHEEAQKG